MIEMTFLEGLILIRQTHLKRVLFSTIGIFYIKGLGFNQLFVMVAIMY